jgi:hypothetical protein
MGWLGDFEESGQVLSAGVRRSRIIFSAVAAIVICLALADEWLGGSHTR